jgi:lipid-A-disaccharide synthase-like uncharacterized protein
MEWWEWLGWAGNACFFSRFLVQWWNAERKLTREAPTLFWILSLAGSASMAIYAMKRGVPVLVVGFIVNGLIYLRNLRLGSASRPIDGSRLFALATLAAAALVLAGLGQRSSQSTGEGIAWTVCVVVGQSIWSSRFVAQWWYSESVGISHFPPLFWWMSLAGNSLLLAYAIHLWDPVLIAGLALGPVIQIRNLFITRKATGHQGQVRQDTSVASKKPDRRETEPMHHVSTAPAVRSRPHRAGLPLEHVLRAGRSGRDLRSPVMPATPESCASRSPDFRSR